MQAPAIDLVPSRTARPHARKAVPTKAFVPIGSETRRVVTLAAPTGDCGASLFSARSPGGQFVRAALTDHVVGFLRSRTERVVTRLSGRVFDQHPAPRTLTVFPAGIDATLDYSAPFAFIAARISTECLTIAKAQLGVHGGILIDRVGSKDDTLFKLAAALEAEAIAKNPNGPLFWSSLVDALICHLVSHHLSKSAPGAKRTIGASSLGRLDAFIRDNIGEPIDIARLAAVAGIERFHFAHCFQAAVGMAPHRYVMRLRLQRACELIRHTTDPFAEIALATGFTDQSHLNRWVRRVHNVRPSDLRT